MDVVVLAGARNDGKLKDYTSEKHEALIKIKNRPMIDYVIEAVQNAQKTDRIIVVGPSKDLVAYNDSDVILLEAHGSFLDNIRKGLTKTGSGEYVLIVTSDIPLITSDVIDEFISSCSPKEADIFYPIIPREKNNSSFPEIERTYVRLSEGTYTGGNIVIINSEVFQKALPILEKIISLRKKPFKLIRLLGIKFIFKYIIGFLSITDVEERASEIIGYKGLSKIVEHPEVGFDVDKPSDLQQIRKMMKA